MNDEDVTDDGRESRESLSQRYPKAFVRALRATPIPLSSGSSNAASPAQKYASAGVGLRDLGRMQICQVNASDMYDIDCLPMAAQGTLGDIRKAKINRAREKTMEELNSILHRVQFTLHELKTAEQELTLRETPDSIDMQKRKRKTRRTKKKKRAKEEEKATKEDDVGRKDGEDNKLQTDTEIKNGLQQIGKEGASAIETENGTERDKFAPNTEVATEREDSLTSSSCEYDSDSSWFSDEENESESDEKEKQSDVLYFSTPPGMKKENISYSVMRTAERRRRTSDAIACYLEQCLEREDIMLQMKSWMETATIEDIPSPFSGNQPEEYRYSPNLLSENLPLDVGSSVETYKRTLERLKGIADSLGIGEAGKSDEEAEQPPPGKPGLPPPPKPKVGVKIFDDDELSIPENLEMAATSLVKVLDEAAKSTPTRRTRVSLYNGLKQFRFIYKVLEKRDEKINLLDKEMVDLGGDLARTKKQNEELRKTKKKMQMQHEKQLHQTNDLKVKLKRQDDLVENLNKIVEDYKRKESYGLYRESSNESSASSNSEESSDFTNTEAKPEKKSKKKRKKKKGGAKGKGKKKKNKTRTSGTSEGSEIQEKSELVGTPTTGPDEEVTISLSDLEKTDVFQDLKLSLEKAKNEVQIEQEKLAEFETEFENVKSDKVRIEQEKADLEIEIENVKRQQEIEMEEFKDEIDDLQRENKKYKGEIECNEEMIQYQEERISQYVEEIQNMEERIMSLPGTPAMSSTSFAKSARRERRRTSIGLIEPPTARQMMAKIKQQYETEIQGLKDHLTKESQRHQADTRRRDQEHKKDIQNIHKESLLVLRAINRFKDCAANLLDRENIVAEAHALRKLPPLLLDDTPGETRQMLARMAILSNELLVSIELQLSKALMSKRLEMKDTSTSRGIVKRELESQTDALRKVKGLSTLQAGKLKTARDEILDHEAEIIRFKLQKGEKQEVLEERYTELLSVYIALRKEGIAMRKAERPDREKDEEISRKEAIIIKYMRKEKNMQRVIEEHKKVIANLTVAWRTRRFSQLYICKSDQLENLNTLNDALTMDKIPKGLHEMTTNLIKEAIELPRKRLIELIKNYVRYIQMKEMEERAKKVKIEEDLGDGSMKFLYMLEKRIQQQKEIWTKKRDEFVSKRADILMHLSRTITRVSEETGVLLTKPKILTKRAGDTQSQDSGIPDLYEAVKIMKEKHRLRKFMEAQINARIPVGTGEPIPPYGTGMGYAGYPKVPMWRMKATYSHVTVATPKILDLDVNQTRLAAQEIIAQVSKGSWDTGSTSLPKINTSTSKVFPVVPKSVSEPITKTEQKTKTKKSWTLPSIATMYSSEDWSEANH